MNLSIQLIRAHCNTHYPEGAIVIQPARRSGLSSCERQADAIVRHVLRFLGIYECLSMSQVSRRFWHCLNQSHYLQECLVRDASPHFAKIREWAERQEAGVLSSSEWYRLAHMPRIHQIPWEQERRFRYADAVSCIARLPNGSFTTALRDETVHICSPSGQSRVLKDARATSCIAVFPDGRLALAIRTILSISSSNGQFQVLKGRPGHTAEITCLAILPDGRLASGSRDYTVRIRSMDGQCQVLYGHTDVVQCLAVLPDGRLASGSLDRTVRIWTIRARDSDSQVLEATSSVWCLAVLPNGCLAAGTSTGDVLIWTLDGQFQVLQSNSDRGAGITCLTALPDGRLASGSFDYMVCIWSINGQPEVLQGHHAAVNSLVALPNGSLVSGSSDRTMRIWRPRRRQRVHSPLYSRMVGRVRNNRLLMIAILVVAVGVLMRIVISRRA